MAEDTNELSVPIGADPSGLRQGMNEAVQIVERGASRINQSIRGIADIGGDLAKLGTILSTSVTLPIIALGTASIKAYGEIQALQKGLEAAAGSAAYAGRQFEDLKEVAKLPGLGLGEAVKGSINLQAIGLSAGKSERILQSFGNAVASVGKGRVEFERAIYGISQLANTEFPLGEDLNIVADALPQVRSLLKDTFGATRSDDLKKMGVSSKQVLDAILTGLEKLPKVNGGIKNAFENLGDSLQQNLARIGKSIDDNFDISGIIDKLTSLLDKAISKFESLSQPVQELILIFTALAAVSGPVLLGLGGILALLPTLISGFAALRTAVIAFNTAMLTNPYLAVGAALLSIVTILSVYRLSIETVADRQERWNDALIESNIRGRQEVSSLDALYKKTQDHKLSIEERNKAIDQIQKEYPYYFGNLTNEAVLAGKAGVAYNSLRKAILNASVARAAQKELDTRNESALQRELEFTKKITSLIGIQKVNSSALIKKYIKDYENALTTGEKLRGGVSNPFANSALIDDSEIKTIAKRTASVLMNNYAAALKQANRENSPLLNIIKRGAQDIENLDISAPDTIIEGVAKVKKETEKQIAEIFPVGSIAELRQRAELLKKAIETSVDGIVKVRGLDKFGKDKDKKGNPYFTGEILSLEEALNRLEDLGIRAGDIEIQPIKFNSKGLLDQFGNEYKSFNDLMLAQVIRTGAILGYQLPQVIDTAAQNTLAKAIKLEEVFQKTNESIKSLIEDSTLDGISDIFATLGESLATGQSALQAIGQSILATLGNFISKFGMELVKTALLSEVFGGLIIAIKNAFGNPYVLLALGAAAIAVGAAVSASAKRTSSTASGGNFSSSAGVSSGNNYTSSYMNGGGGGNNEIRLRVDGRDLVTVLNRNVIEQDRLNAG